MALITLCSVKGAPGVTTTALAMTLTWPRPALLVEADPSGGSSVMAGFFRGQVSLERSVLSMTMAAAHSSVEQVLWSQCLQLPGAEGKSLLAAAPTFAQAQLTRRVWVELAEVLAGLDRGGVDVLVDAGRVSATNSPTPLIERSDAVLVMTTAGLPALHAARGSIGYLQQHLETTSTGADSLAVLVRDGDHDAYSRNHVINTLRAPVLATVPEAAGDARVYSHGRTPERRHENGDYLRAVRRAGANVRELVAKRREQLTRPDAAPTGAPEIGWEEPSRV